MILSELLEMIGVFCVATGAVIILFTFSMPGAVVAYAGFFIYAVSLLIDY